YKMIKFGSGMVFSIMLVDIREISFLRESREYPPQLSDSVSSIYLLMSAQNLDQGKETLCA
ncbi:MAG: hypothetical protein ACYC4G_09545, partial [Acidithiobacillus ferrooxidans]